VTTFEFGEESPVAPDEGGIGQDSELTENTDRRRLDVRTEDGVDDDTVTLSRIRQVLKSVEHAVYEWNIAEDTLHWGDNVGDLLPVPDLSLLNTGRGFASFLDSDNLTNRYEAVMNSGQSDEGEGVPYEIQYRVFPHGRNGHESCWIEDAGKWFGDENGKPAKAQGIIRLFDERHQREQELAYLSSYDPLTGHMNRLRLSETLEEALKTSEKTRQPCAFLLAAINNLAMVNDAYGFDVADQVIAAVANRIKGKLRGGDTMGRYAGNKFGILLTNCNDEDMRIAAGRLDEVIRGAVIETDVGPVSAAISLGGVVMPRHAHSAQEGMVRAEEALGLAKQRHMDHFVPYEYSSKRESLRKRNVMFADEIISALNDRRLRLGFQPIVDAQTGQPAHYECLLRLVKPNNEIVSAGHFIPVAEQLGLVRLIDHRVLELTIEALLSAPHVNLTFNVSGLTATDPSWLANLKALIQSNHQIADRLTVEITETVAINDIEESTKFVSSLRDLGCRIAIDDFGAGYTSFQNLKLMNVDMVKIDGSFVENLHKSPDNQFFVRTLIDLAKNFKLQTVAEWVENERDVDLLRDWGIDYMQGFLFGAAQMELPSAPEETVKTHEEIIKPQKRLIVRHVANG